MQQRRNRTIWLIVIVVAAFFIIDPFQLLTTKAMPEYRTTDEMRTSISEFLAGSASPDDFLAEMLDRYDVVMLAPSGFRNPEYVKQQVDFLVDAIRTIHRVGATVIGFEYGAKRDQDRIDQLVTDTYFDEQLASDILFDYQVTAGYQEYIDVYRAVWQLNRSLSEDEEPLRIVALSNPPNYTAIESTTDVENPDVMRRVFAEGSPDAQIAETILQDIVPSADKAVVFTQAQHAFTRFEQESYTAGMANLGFANERTAGNLVYTALGDRVATVVMHGPIEDRRPRLGYGYPLGGLVESGIESLDAVNRRRGFLTADFPTPEAPIVSTVVQEGRDSEILFSEYTDGYIVLGAIGDYVPLTAIPDFITEDRLATAIRNFPGANPNAGREEVTVSQMNEFIAGTAQAMQQIFDAFK
jgi:hypothetical protein